MSAIIIRLKGWPDEWKPFLVSWKRLKGTIPSCAGDWPWELDLLRIMEKKGCEMKWQNTEYLRESSITQTLVQNNLFSDGKKKENWTWQLIGWIPNKMKDILWRMLHNALPLGTRLVHITPNVDQQCPWCTNEVQSLEHFTISCRISKKLWKLAYEIAEFLKNTPTPHSIEEIITASNVRGPQPHSVVVWLHANVLY